jgi:hypothetical protein
MYIHYQQHILLLSIFTATSIINNDICLCQEQATSSKLKQQISHLEDLWNASKINDYYHEADFIVSTIIKDTNNINVNKEANILFNNLLVKESNKNVDIGLHDLSLMNKLALYLISYDRASKEERQSNCMVLSKYLGRIRNEIVPNYSPKNVVENVMPPSAVSKTPRFPGMDPKAISDPVARTLYESAIRNNQDNILCNSRQTELNMIQHKMSKPIIVYMNNIFRKDNISSSIINECIKNAKLTDEEKKEIEQ